MSAGTDTGLGGSDTPGSPAPGKRATAREWAGLAFLVLPMLVVATDLTVLFFAVPTISADLDPSATQALWIVHVYGFLVAGFLVTAGRVGDRVGPRRLLLIGSTAFAALSAAAAFSTSPEMLIVLRGLMGIAGATLMPSLFSLLRTMFQDDTQRRFAIAVILSAFSAGGAIGPLLGGALLEFFWWGSVFLINVPPVLLFLAVATRLVPERQERIRTRIDVPSIVLSVAGMLGLVYGLQELAATQEEGSGSVLGNLGVAVGGALVLGIFVHRQRRIDAPLFDLALFANRRVAISLVTLLVVGISVVGVFYLFAQYLQWVGGYTPLQAGLWTLPYVGLNIVGAMIAPALAGRLATRSVMAGGLVIAALGAVLVGLTADPDTPLVLLVAAVSVAALGQGMAIALISDLIISGAPASQSGSAAAAQEVSGELGTALGVAVGGAVSMLVYRTVLPGAAPSAVPESSVQVAQSTIHEGVTTAENLPDHGAALLSAVHEAVTSGLQVFSGVGAALTVAVTVLVIIAFAGRRGTGAESEGGTLGGDVPADESVDTPGYGAAEAAAAEGKTVGK